MNVHSAGYFFKEGFKNIWLNGVMSIASILVMTCCMVLTGGALLLSINLNNALKTVENQNSVTVFLEKNVTANEAVEIGEQIKKLPNILKCEYYSSQQAAEKYRDVLGDLYDIVQEGDNPFPEAFHVTMGSLSKYNNTIESIQSVPKVETISDRSETAKRLSNLNRLVATAGVWIIFSLGLVSLFIISNTIKLTMHSRRFEINIMKSVGATNWFIRAPFIIEGIIIGCIAAIISTILLNLVYDTLLGYIGEIIAFNGIGFKNIFWKIFGCFIATGVFFGVSGGVISISRYLKKEGTDIVFS